MKDKSSEMPHATIKASFSLGVGRTVRKEHIGAETPARTIRASICVSREDDRLKTGIPGRSKLRQACGFPVG